MTQTLEAIIRVVIGTVWVFHGGYSKLLNGIPRHRQIVARVLGTRFARELTILIGCGEVALGIWVFTGWARYPCALVQTAALLAMNALEIALAGDLLISAVGMVLLNVAFLSLVWWWTLTPTHG